MSDQPTNEPVPMEADPLNPSGSIEQSVTKSPELIPQATFDAAIQNWLGTHVRGTAVTEYAQAWSHLSSVLPELKGFLEKEMAKGQP